MKLEIHKKEGLQRPPKPAPTFYTEETEVQGGTLARPRPQHALPAELGEEPQANLHRAKSRAAQPSYFEQKRFFWSLSH